MTYHVFAGDNYYYPEGGAKDYKDSKPTLEEAVGLAETHLSAGMVWAHVSNENFKVLWSTGD